MGETLRIDKNMRSDLCAYTCHLNLGTVFLFLRIIFHQGNMQQCSDAVKGHKYSDTLSSHSPNKIIIQDLHIKCLTKRFLNM